MNNLDSVNTKKCWQIYLLELKKYKACGAVAGLHIVGNTQQAFSAVYLQREVKMLQSGSCFKGVGKSE